MESDAPPFSVTDLHSHLAPGVDDGTRSVAESLDSLRALHAEGVRTLVTTPHLLLPHLESDAAVDRELARHRRAFDEVVAASRDVTGLPALGLGQEIWAPDAAAARRVARHPDVGLAGTAFLLVEFGFDLAGSHEDVIRAFHDAGRRVVVSHPERYHYLPGTDPIEQMRAWRQLGALLQLNCGSLTGHYRGHSPDSEALAWRMVETGLVDLIATDHHGPRRAGVSPRDAFRALAARALLDLAERAMADLPGRVVQGGILYGGAYGGAARGEPGGEKAEGRAAARPSDPATLRPG